MKIFSAGFITAFALSVIGGSAFSKEIAFDQSWQEQGFMRLWSNDYDFLGSRLEIESDNSVSLIWRAVEPELRNASKARWKWSVSQGVKVTDLSSKGGDDRDLALYFVFGDPKVASRVPRAKARQVLQSPNMRGLVYVWGGEEPSRGFEQSPYHPNLLFQVLRPARVGEFMEEIDLQGDFIAAFGEQEVALIGLGISADSDDTNGLIRASVENLILLGN
jgi:hypothetical protein